MITSNQLSIYASPTTEDDGWVEGDDDSQGEISNQEELEDAYEGSQWEDDIGPNEFEEKTNDDDDDDSKSHETAQKSVVQSAIINETATAPTENSYCLNVGKEDENNAEPFETEEYQNCLKVNGDKTYYQGVIDGCRDRANTQKDCERWYGLSTAPHPMDRGDVTFGILLPNQHDEEFRSNAVASSSSVEESSCNIIGGANGIQQVFDTAKSQACGLYPNGQKAYSDGFVMGCTQIGNTQLICQSLVDNSILNMKTQPIQTTTPPQPTQGIQPAPMGG